MSGTTANELGSVQKTLFLPLWGRAVETGRACSPRGVELANQKVIKAGGMDDSAILKWGLQRARDMERWDSRIAVVAAYPIFRNMRRALHLREKWGTFVSDALNIMFMVHLRLGSG